MSFVASSNVFLTVSNPLNSSTAAELRNSNSFTYTFSMGGKPFSLQSLRVVTRGFGQTTVRSAFGTRTFSNVTTGLVNLADAAFRDITSFEFSIPFSIARLIFDDLTVQPLDRFGFPPPPPSFINWETAPVHPIALSPGGDRLAVCNLPDNRLELFDLSSGNPVPAGNVSVGLDPVSVQWRTSNEVWVVNYMSDSVSIVDAAAARVVATLETLDTPSDVVFAGTPQRAFVSCSMPNKVQVFDPIGRVAVAEVAIDAERPKALAVSPDGTKVYAAIFESGNASTIIGPSVINGVGPSAVDNTNGPYAGQNPPPNSGSGFNPPMNSTNPAPPKVPHIVQKNAIGRWMDDNHADWTEFISGTNAALTQRRLGWDMPDNDLAIIDTASLSVSYATRLMNLCMNVGVNPVSGKIAVVGTDGINATRFEPNLNGTFLRVQLALVEPATLNKTIKDLNPHLDYITRTLPESERNKTVGDPRGIIWNSSGTRAYITGMGSGNLVVIDSDGNRVGTVPLALGEGPTGMALDEPRHRLYVLNRFSASISVVDIDAQAVIATVWLFDPTPQVIKTGRKHLYDTHKNSGLGQASCASCHPEARMDRLAWDLGDPAGGMLRVTNFASAGAIITNNFHPMKGPMVTMTLQDIIGHEPFHWRSDRRGIEEFAQTFTNLQAAAVGPTTNEMKEFKDFLATIYFPPNPYRQFDNSLSTNIPLPGFNSLGRGTLPKGAQLVNGNAFAGMNNVMAPRTGGCMECHSFPSGLSMDTGLPGPNGERHLISFNNGRFGGIPPFFKPAQLRGLYEKTGLDFDSSSSRAGFGFTHNGNSDTLVRFLQDAFTFVSGQDQQTADFIAFLLSFSGSNLPKGDGGIDSPRGLPSKDVPAAVGKQITINGSSSAARLDAMLALANNPTSRVELVVKGAKDGLSRGWIYVRGAGQFQSDRRSETISPDDLRGLAVAGNELTYTIVPEGSGTRIGIDRDEDGFLDRDELDFPSDAANPASIPVRTLANILVQSNSALISWNSITGKTYQVQFNNRLSTSAWSNLPPDIVARDTNALATDSGILNAPERYYRIRIVK